MVVDGQVAWTKILSTAPNIYMSGGDEMVAKRPEGGNETKIIVFVACRLKYAGTHI